MFNLLNVSVLFLLLGLISGLSTEPKKDGTSKDISKIEKVVNGETYKAAICVFSILAILMVGGRLVTKQYVSAAESKGAAEAMEAYRWAVVTDPLNATAYRSACITRYISNPDLGGVSLVVRFAEDLAKNAKNPSDNYQLARYYQGIGDVENATASYERYIEQRRVNPKAWNEVLAQYFRLMVPKSLDNPELEAQLPVYVESAYRLKQYLETLNETLDGKVTPDKTLASVLDRAVLVCGDGMALADALEMDVGE